MDPSGVPVTSLTSISYRSCLDTLATLTSCSRNSPGRSQGHSGVSGSTGELTGPTQAQRLAQ